ncbi:hypothetical protein WJX81_006934 [Elliptochloris bilobata]|uniref:C2H2-type domain-containing protein n=1 Tax=Elliptochloris bilobata TaxID=381761 RepID=A0AAW1RGD9_9CHLO
MPAARQSKGQLVCLADRDPNRFFCPYEGCSRSFAELWRLKVHYRAPPDVRGSGKERGHGCELQFCPKCGKELKAGKHHVGCYAGRVTPRNTAKRMKVGDEDDEPVKPAAHGARKDTDWRPGREVLGRRAAAQAQARLQRARSDSPESSDAEEQVLRMARQRSRRAAAAHSPNLEPDVGAARASRVGGGGGGGSGARMSPLADKPALPASAPGALCAAGDGPALAAQLDYELSGGALAPPASPVHFPLPPRLASPLSAGPRGSDSPEAFMFDHFGLFGGGARSPGPGSPALNPNLNPVLSLGRSAHTSELTDSLARLAGGQGSGGAGLLGTLFDDGATPRRIAAHLHHWEGTDDLESAEAHVTNAALRLAAGLPPPSPFGAVAASPFGPPPLPAAGDGLPSVVDVYMGEAHTDVPAVTPPSARGQVCEFDALLSILERSPAPAGLPRAPSAPHPNPNLHRPRVSAPGSGCRIASAGSDSLALHRGGVSAADDSLAMQPRWAARGGSLQPAYGGRGADAEDEVDAELRLGFGAKFGGWLAGDGWDALSSGEAVQGWGACASAKAHASPEVRCGAQRGAPPTPLMEAAARRRLSADSEPLAWCDAGAGMRL